MIGLHDADATSYPNLALMKMSAVFKQNGKESELWRPEGVYENAEYRPFRLALQRPCRYTTHGHTAMVRSMSQHESGVQDTHLG